MEKDGIRTGDGESGLCVLTGIVINVEENKNNLIR